MENKERLPMGMAVKEIRKKEKISAKEFAARTGLTTTYISRFENDDIPNPSFSTIMSIIKVMAKFDVMQAGEVNLSNYDEDFVNLLLTVSGSPVEAKSSSSPFDDSDLTDTEKNFFGDYVSYKNDSIALDKWEASFIKKLNSICRDKSFDDYAAFAEEESSLLISSFGESFRDDFVADYSKLHNLKKRINKDLTSILENPDEINSFDVLNLFRRMIRFWFSYLHYKINDVQENEDDDEE